MVVVTRGSCYSDSERSSTSNDEIRTIISTKVAAMIKEVVLEIFGSNKTMPIELFDERYVAVTEAATVATTAVIATAKPHEGDSM